MPDDTSSLSDLADEVADSFAAHRQPDGFNAVSFVIDDSDPDRETLIGHVDRDDAAALADEVEAFLRDRGAHAGREGHDTTDVRLGTAVLYHACGLPG
jgi:hypothetical protein